MASNPMQRKARNSFLLGVIITLIIAGVIVALLFVQLKQKTEELNTEINAKVNVYVLNQNVKSGQVLTQDMFTTKKIHKDSIPSNATALYSVIESWFLQTKDGTMVNTDSQGLYMNIADSIMEVIQENGQQYKCAGGEKIAVSSRDDVIQDDEGAYVIDASNSVDTITRIYQEPLTGEYYTYKLDDSAMTTSGNKTRVKEYLEMKNVPLLAKVNMNANTVMTQNLVVQSNEVVRDDTRQEEYNMIVLPIDLMANDYVDIRLMTPSGQNFIVVSKVKVDIPVDGSNEYIADTIRINLNEDEILSMSSAIVEAYGLLGAKLYATKYVEAGMQEPALPTYTPNAAVTTLIDSDPNIVDKASEELRARYSDSAKRNRNDYLQSLINSSGDYTSNIQENLGEDVTNQKSTRQRYLESIQY